MVLFAELVTLDNPCCALPAISDAPSLALAAPEDAVLWAASVVEEAARFCSIHRDWDCLKASRGSVVGAIVAKRGGG